jgi:DNA polymerase III sliding clamp (beta) subunit (PCNA family)
MEKQKAIKLIASLSKLAGKNRLTYVTYNVLLTGSHAITTDIDRELILPFDVFGVAEPVMVDCASLKQAVQATKATVCHFSVTEEHLVINDVVKIRLQKDPDLFPRFRPDEDAKPLGSLSVKSNLTKLMNEAKVFKSKDTTRPNMTYTALLPQTNELAATDAFGVIVLAIDVEGDITHDVLIPELPIDVAQCSISCERRKTTNGNTIYHYLLHTDEGTIRWRVGDHRYPQIHSVIPTRDQCSEVYKVDADELLGALNRTLAVVGKMPAVVLTFADDALSVHAENVDYKETHDEQLAIEPLEGFGLAIGFNTTLLIRQLSSFKGRKVEILMSQPSRAALILCADRPEILTSLIMPVMINV